MHTRRRWLLAANLGLELREVFGIAHLELGLADLALERLDQLNDPAADLVEIRADTRGRPRMGAQSPEEDRQQNSGRRAGRAMTESGGVAPPIMAWAITRERIRRIAVFRLVLAVAIWFAAAETRLPLVTQILAGVTAFAGLSTLLMPFDKLEKMVEWWLKRSDQLLLPYLLIVLAFGLFLMWLAWPVAT